MTTAFRPRMVAPGEGKTVMLFGVRFGYKVESAHSGGSLAVLEVQIPAKTLVKPHNHSREDEFSLVLEGTVGVRVGDRVLEAGPGAYLVEPRGTPMPCGTRPVPRPGLPRSSARAGWSPTSRSWRPSWMSTAPRRCLRARRALRDHHPRRLDQGPGSHLRREALTGQRTPGRQRGHPRGSDLVPVGGEEALTCGGFEELEPDGAAVLAAAMSLPVGD